MSLSALSPKSQDKGGTLGLRVEKATDLKLKLPKNKTLHDCDNDQERGHLRTDLQVNSSQCVN